MLNIAYIGNGKSVNRYHLPFSMIQSNINVKYIYSRNSSSEWESFDSIKYTQELDELLLDDDLDLIVICTPVNTHFELGWKCLEFGKNVLIEKPFTMSSVEAKELFSFAKEKQLFIQAYQNRRFDSDFLTLQKIIKSEKLGELLELEMHYDYYRPEIPLGVKNYKPEDSFIYGHGCHTIDQVISYFGFPDIINYDVRQLLGTGRMNDYFDIDMYYETLKISVKSSYFRIKARPSFILYGTKGMFIKHDKDRQEIDLKHFYMPRNADFGIDFPENFGTITYYDKESVFHEEKVISEKGDYGEIYRGVYNSIVNNADKIVKDEETICQIEILEQGISPLS